jgi:hypothetical protein
MAESRAARPPDRRQGLPWKITVQSGAKRRPKDASAASALDGDLCAARECPARGGRPNQFSRSRSCGCVAAGTACLAGAGLLTWWRRRAQRAPARQGSACRPPRSRRGLPDPVRLRPPTRPRGRNGPRAALPGPSRSGQSNNSARSSPPRGLTGCSPSIAWPPDRRHLTLVEGSWWMTTLPSWLPSRSLRSTSCG